MTRTPTWPPVIRSAMSAAVLTIGAIMLTACSSTTSANTAQSGPSASASTGARSEQMAAYRQCLSQHGVTLPARPSGGPSGRPSGGGFGGGSFGGFGSGGGSADPARQKAMQACAALRPQFNGGGGRGNFDSLSMKAFASCLKDHGVALPSASPGHGLRGLNTTDPRTAQAFQICRPLLPQRPSGAPMPSTTPSN
ncbi:hypothetical protein ACH4UM_29390 [Streptomyces sp. NPDC020801]|uniref:hypothetical protein n=1 Tax=unclassified Streptomyces TaxID=2593676 RepID=UPI0037B97E99